MAIIKGTLTLIGFGAQNHQTGNDFGPVGAVGDAQRLHGRLVQVQQILHNQLFINTIIGFQNNNNNKFN